MGLIASKPAWDQVLNPNCSATETSYNIDFFYVANLDLILSREGELCLPPGRVGRHIVFPLAPVCLSVKILCLLYNLKTVRDISMKLHTFVKHILTTCHAQESYSALDTFGVIPL